MDKPKPNATALRPLKDAVSRALGPLAGAIRPKEGGGPGEANATDLTPRKNAVSKALGPLADALRPKESPAPDSPDEDNEPDQRGFVCSKYLGDWLCRYLNLECPSELLSPSCKCTVDLFGMRWPCWVLLLIFPLLLLLLCLLHVCCGLSRCCGFGGGLGPVGPGAAGGGLAGLLASMFGIAPELEPIDSPPPNNLFLKKAWDTSAAPQLEPIEAEASTTDYDSEDSDPGPKRGSVVGGLGRRR